MLHLSQFKNAFFSGLQRHQCSSGLAGVAVRRLSGWDPKESANLLDHHNHKTREGLRNLFKDVKATQHKKVFFQYCFK